MAATVGLNIWDTISTSFEPEPECDESYNKLTRKVLFEKYKPDSKFNKKQQFGWWNGWSKVWISPGIYTREVDFSNFSIMASGTTSYMDYDDDKYDYGEKSYEAVVLPDRSPEPLYKAKYRLLDKEFVPP